MEKMHFNQKNEIPQNLKQFYSRNPREVLGVANNASTRDIVRARNELQREFYPDFNKDPRAVEISQNINAAYDILTGKSPSINEGSFQSTPPSRSEKSRSAPPTEHIDPIAAEIKNYYYGKGVESAEDIVVWELYCGYLNFSDFLERRSKKWGIKEDQIREIIKSDQGQQSAQHMFITEFWDYLSKLNVDGGERYSETVERWAKLGVDISSFINTIPQITKGLESAAKIKLRWDQEKFKPYVQSWIKAGWKPSAEIMSALEKA